MAAQKSLLGAVVLALVSCPAPVPKKPVTWKPGMAYATQRDAVYRGFLDRRGLIHSHSIHSHDACDGHPDNIEDDTPPGTPVELNKSCYQDFRDDLCQAQIDFAFLTDHRSRFDDTEYDPFVPDPLHPEKLEGDNATLWSQSRGDELVKRNDSPVANRIQCADGRKVLIMPGNEGTNLMPVGLEHHVPGRGSIYGASTSPSKFPDSIPEVTNAVNLIHEAGGLALVAHSEGLTAEQIATFPLDGFEMYNVHANVLFDAPYGPEHAGALILNMQAGDISMMPDNADLVFLAFFHEDPNYLSRWASVLSQGKKRVTTMGSDCHQNSIPQMFSKSLKPTWDDMRGDKYQRVMRWFSNHLLVTPNADGSYDDSNLKAALKAGRLYGAFEVLGYPVGFDYHATAGGTLTEMGGEVALSASPVMSVKLPAIQDLDASRQPPQFKVRILRANGEAWDEVAKGSGDLTFSPTQAGAYRAEIREIPYHLREEMGPAAEEYLAHDYVWIYSNAIYVR